jgi:hypothetical protein
LNDLTRFAGIYICLLKLLGRRRAAGSAKGSRSSLPLRKKKRKLERRKASKGCSRQGELKANCWSRQGVRKASKELKALD